MTDSIETAEEYLKFFDEHPDRYTGARGCIRMLVADLKAVRAELASYTEFAEQEFERLHREGA